MIADLAMQRALDAYHRAGVDGLTEPDKTLATLWCFESEVANSGFEHFYRSNAGELAGFAPAAFRAIGAEELAVLAERANAVFGPGGVPAVRRARLDALAALPPSARATFETLENEYASSELDIDGLIERFVASQQHAPPV